MKPPDARYSADAGTNEFWFLSDTVALGRTVGALDAAMATWFLARCDAWVGNKPGPLLAFHDWEAMTSYDMKARILFAAWIIQNRARFKVVHVLVRSKVIELGVTMTNLALGRVLVAHSTRETFDRELRAAAARVNADVPL